MAITSSADLADALERLSLLEPAQLAALPRLVAQCADTNALAQELRNRCWLTPFQAERLMDGQGNELVLGNYVLLDLLGQGGMGQVFRARHRNLGRIVAVKLIRKERLDSPNAVQRFEREIRAAAKLKHPNVVLALDADCVGDTHFFTMEYVEGTDLAKLVKQRGPLPFAQACDYIGQAALGLSHAHEHGLVHRDIKPSNLLLTEKGSVIKLLDLGMARLVGAKESDATSSLTSSGAVMGTPDYIAPEQTRGAHKVDIRADLYSLGCTFYFLLTGQVPFPGASIGEKLLAHQMDDPTPLHELRPETPLGVAGVVTRLMAKQPENRFQTPAELVAVIEKGLRAGQWPEPVVLPSTVNLRAQKIDWGPKGRPLQQSSGSGLQETALPLTTSAEPFRRKPPRSQWRLAVTVAVVAGLIPAFALILFLRSDKPIPNGRPAASVPKPAPIIRTQPASKPTVADMDDPARWAKAISLLPLINIDKDREKGEWKFLEGALVAEAAEQTSLYLPYRPPVEYDFRIVFSTPEFNWVSHSGSYEGRVIEWSMAGNENLARLGELVKITNVAALDPAPRYSTILSVRKNHIQGYIRGQLISEWTPSQTEIGYLNDERRLGVLASNTRAVFHTIDVLEISGRGEFTRPDDPAAQAAAKRLTERTFGRP